MEANVLDDVETIGSRIRTRRSALGLSQTALGDQVGVGRKAIGYFESGGRQPSVRTLPRLAAALGVSMSWLLSGEESAGEHELAIHQELSEIRDAIRVLERQLFDLYRLVERLAEQQIRYLSPGDPPWLDEPES